MYKKELETLLNNNFSFNNFLLFGACEYQIDYFTNKIIDKWGLDSECFKMYFDEYDFNQAKNYLSQGSLFGNENLLLIKTDKILPKKEIEDLINLSNKNQNSYFLYVLYSDDSKSRSISDVFKKNFVRFFKTTQSESLLFLSEKSKQLKLNIDSYSLTYLLKIQNDNLMLAISELEKLSILEQPITTRKIEENVFGTGAAGIDDFIQTLLEKKDFKPLYINLKHNGIDEIFFISSISNAITQLFLFHSYIKLNGKIDTKDILGYTLPQHITETKTRIAIKIPITTYSSLLSLLTIVETKLKTGMNSDKDSLLLNTLIKIQSLL